MTQDTPLAPLLRAWRRDPVLRIRNAEHARVRAEQAQAALLLAIAYWSDADLRVAELRHALTDIERATTLVRGLLLEETPRRRR